MIAEMHQEERDDVIIVMLQAMAMLFMHNGSPFVVCC